MTQRENNQQQGGVKSRGTVTISAVIIFLIKSYHKVFYSFYIVTILSSSFFSVSSYIDT